MVQRSHEFIHVGGGGSASVGAQIHNFDVLKISQILEERCKNPKFLKVKKIKIILVLPNC